MAKRKIAKPVKTKRSLTFKKVNLKVLGGCLLLGGLFYCLSRPAKPIYESNEFKVKEAKSSPEKDYQETSFQDLSDKDHLSSDTIRYGQKMDDKSIESINEIMKKSLRNLIGKGVAVRGFMVPVDSEGGMVHQFTLMRTIPNCAFCPVPGVADWINVTADKGIRLDQVPNSPVLIRGIFQAGAQVQDGDLISLYRMKADEVITG